MKDDKTKTMTTKSKRKIELYLRKRLTSLECEECDYEGKDWYVGRTSLDHTDNGPQLRCHRVCPKCAHDNGGLLKEGADDCV